MKKHDIPVVGGDASLGLSFELAKPFSICLLTDLAIGTRGYGLGVRIWTLGFDAAYRLERLRLGVGAGTGLASLDRATHGDAFLSLEYAVWATASYDIAQWGDLRTGAIFIGARLESTLPVSRATAVWGPSAGLGIRF